MIHNSFRRIALAQGLLPVRAYLADLPTPDHHADPRSLEQLADAAFQPRSPDRSVGIGEHETPA